MRFFILWLWIITLNLNACMWLEGTTIDGEYIRTEERVDSMFLHFSMEKEPQDAFQNRFADLNKSTDEYRAVEMMTNGQIEDAITLLHKIEESTPNRYDTAVNLGTAYELSGNNQEADRWIAEGMRRDSHSHHGTEWLHLFILKSKISLANRDNNSTQKRLIPLPEKFDKSTKIEIDGHTYTIKELHEALFYQLRERLIFVKPKDTIVAELLYTLARIHEQTSVVNEAKNIMLLSKQYGFENPSLIHKHLEQYSTITTISIIKYATIAILILILIFTLNYFYLKSKKGKTIEKRLTSPLSFSFLVIGHMMLFFILGLGTSILFMWFFSLLFDEPMFKLQSFIHYMIVLLFYYFAILAVLKHAREKLIIEDENKSIQYTLIAFIVVDALFIKIFVNVSILDLLYHVGLIALLFWMLHKYFAINYQKNSSV